MHTGGASLPKHSHIAACLCINIPKLSMVPLKLDTKADANSMESLLYLKTAWPTSSKKCDSFVILMY